MRIGSALASPASVHATHRPTLMGAYKTVRESRSENLMWIVRHCTETGSSVVHETSVQHWQSGITLIPDVTQVGIETNWYNPRLIISFDVSIEEKQGPFNYQSLLRTNGADRRTTTALQPASDFIKETCLLAVIRLCGVKIH